MSFRRYPDYRESGAELLGDVPGHWTVCHLKRLARLAYGDALPSDVRNDGGEIEVFGSNGPVGLHDASNTHAPVIFVGRKGSHGALKWSDRPGFAIDTVYFIDRHSCCADLRWLYWALHPLRLDRISQDTGVPGLPREAAHETPVAVPTEAEQRSIAAFLDRETAKIDALVGEQRRLIELLKEKRQAVISHAVTKGLDPTAPMKDSGVEWLGEVPAHWEVTRLANLFKEFAEPLTEDLPILSVSIHHGVSDEELDEDDLERKVSRSEDRSKYKRVGPNDLVYNMMRAWQGGFGTVSVEGGVSPAYVVARPKGALETSFVEWLLRTPQCVEEMRTRSVGVTDFRLRLYWDEFKELRIAMPPVAEQRRILGDIRAEVERYQQLSETAEAAIDLLIERRAALISAAVTGKIDLRDTRPAQAELEPA